MKKFILPPPVKIAYFVSVLSFAIAYIFLMHQQAAMPQFGPNKGDAGNYIQMSGNLLLGLKGGIRTYGYPLFLKLIGYPTSENADSLKLFSFYILAIQYALYALAVLFLAFSVTTSQNIRLLIISALLLQINVLSFLSVTLTEILSLSMLLISCGIFFGIKRMKTQAFLLGLCAAFSVEVRPANLWVYVFISTIFLLEFAHYKTNKIEFLQRLGFFAVGSFISFGPQIYFNWLNFHTITPLPARGLGQMQLKWGKEIAYIAFALIPDVFINNVRNPFMGTSPHHFAWFSLNGFSYGLLKIMIMFQHTDLFVYQLLRETYQQLMTLFSSFNTYFGIFGLIMQYKKIPYEKARAIFLGLGLCVLLHLPTALEDRFTFAVCLLLMPFAIYQFWQFCKEKKYKPLSFFILFFLFANLFNSLLESLSANYISAVQAKVLK